LLLAVGLPAAFDFLALGVMLVCGRGDPRSSV
jgi:hypothetical protein